MEAGKYRTIAAATTGDFRDRGSKFLAYAYPIEGADDVKHYVQLLKKEHPKAVHHCFAWRLGTNAFNYRANDDGEPSGSAGKPILGQIDSMSITNVLVVVVRYFGGTLLGVPGLINAYKTATAMALHAATTIDRWVEQRIEVHCNYAQVGEVLYLLKQHEATIYQQDMQLFCIIMARVPLPKVSQCEAKLADVQGVTLKPTQS
jgi:uncharacterized YigZ family protein